MQWRRQWESGSGAASTDGPPAMPPPPCYNPHLTSPTGAALAGVALQSQSSTPATDSSAKIRSKKKHVEVMSDRKISQREEIARDALVRGSLNSRVHSSSTFKSDESQRSSTPATDSTAKMRRKQKHKELRKES